MESKKILIVSSTFYPENSPRSFRTTELVKEFCRQGHQVTLYTIKNNEQHIPIEKEFGVNIKDLGKRKLPNINVGSGSKLAVLFKRVINRTLLQLIHYPDIELMFKVKKALKQESGYDLMISIAVPHAIHWGVAWVRTRKHPIATTWVGDCGDPFMGVTQHDSFGKMFYFKYLEKWFCKKADFISIPILSTMGTYYPEFHHKIVEIPQGFRFEDIQIEKKTPNNKVPTFAFAGIFMRTTRNPTNLVEYLIKKNIDFKFIVYTRTPELLLPYQEILKEKLEIRNYIPRLALLNELSTTDFLINIGFDPENHVPSKLIDYHLTGRPILSFASNEIDEHKLDAFLNGDYSGAFAFNNFDKYKIENVSKSFLKLLAKN